LITAGAILLSGVIAGIAIHHNLSTARRRATIDVVMHEKGTNIALLNARDIVLELHEKKVDCTQFASPDQISSKEAVAIRAVLNFREFVAAGIREKAFDEQMYKRVQYSVIVRDWDSFEGFIRELRKTRNRPTLFQEFQLLAERWRAKPLKTDVQ
jgi:hypothetical protein